MKNKIPVTEEEIKAYLARKERERAKPRPPTLEELERSGVPVSKSGRPLKGKNLVRYYEQRARQA